MNKYSRRVRKYLTERGEWKGAEPVSKKEAKSMI
jgi:hypothetical protein